MHSKRTRRIRPVSIILAGVLATFLPLLGTGRAAATNTYGQDPGLYHPCAAEIDPAHNYYFQDLTACQSNGKRWTLATEGETASTSGHSCTTGVSAQSYPINAGGAMTYAALPQPAGNYTVNLDTTWQGHTNPCPGQSWDWYAYMDHIASGGGGSGGPYPSVTTAQQQVTLNYNDFLGRAADGSRLWVTFQGFWAGVFNEIEVNLVATDWPHAAGLPADIVVTRKSPTVNYVLVDWSVDYGSFVPKSSNETVTINWAYMVNQLIGEQVLPALDANASAAAIGIGTETRQLKPKNGPNANLYFTNFYENSVAGQSTYGSVSPA